MIKENNSGQRPEKEKEKHEDHKVVIQVDDVDRKITPGNHTVSDIKKVGKVTAALDLDQEINGQLMPLSDDATVLIKGGEVFFSRVKDGTSS